jgi:hypothetical protein
MAKPSACGYQTLTNPSASQNFKPITKTQAHSKIQTHQECKRRDAALLRLTAPNEDGLWAFQSHCKKFQPITKIQAHSKIQNLTKSKCITKSKRRDAALLRLTA